MWIDSHAHLGDDKVFQTIEEIIKRAEIAKIDKIVNICTEKLTAERGLELHSKYPFIVNVAATTPHDVEAEGEEMFSYFANLARGKKLVAIGETGLDYFYERASKKVQKAFLCRYLELAISSDLPVVIHCREAFEDLFAICDEHYKYKPLLLHCFTGTKEEAKKALDRGWKISLSGIVTFKKSHELQQLASYLPLSDLLIETDAPYLAPESKRGRMNEPSFVVEVGEKLAELKNKSKEEVALQTSTNAKNFFRI